MRLSIVLLMAVVFLLSSAVSARTLEDLIQNPPPGTYWDEGLRCFVFDPPIPIELPQSPLLSEGSEILYLDGDSMQYAVPPGYEHFVATKFTVPQCTDGWVLTSVLLGCYNNLGEPPDAGKVVVYTHATGEMCIDAYLNPLGDSIGDLMDSTGFVGLDYGEYWDPKDPARAQWTQIDLDFWVTITDTLFWLAWDYRPIQFGNSYFISGNWKVGHEPEDSLRLFEWFGPPCPQLFDFGPWLMRAVGHCEGAGQVEQGKIDVKPQSCPNPINPGDIGVVSVAIVGSEDFDVASVIRESVKLNGVTPERSGGTLEDISAPYLGELCGCWTEYGDGYPELTFKFITNEIYQTLGDPHDGDSVRVTMTWEYVDEGGMRRQMEGSDCFLVRLNESQLPDLGGGGLDHIVIDENAHGGDENLQSGGVRSLRSDVFALHQNTPNPFRSATTICFSLSESAYTTLTVYDVRGRTVAALVDGERAAGVYTLGWNADIPSGIYFYRLQSGGFTATKKLIRMH